MTRGPDQLAVQFCVVLTFTLSGAAIAELNDTGVSKCWSDNAVATTGVETDSGTHPRQDCRYGRDAAAAAGVLPKVGGGSAGFDFSKIANDGSELPESALLGSGLKEWACTRDNVTGLIWEVKTTSGLRNYRHSYTALLVVGPYHLGTVSGGVCETSGRCDTEKYTQDVNAQGLCGASDWRLPDVTELESIVSYDIGWGASGYEEAIDRKYFPNTSNAFSYGYWTRSPHAFSIDAVWVVNFKNGGTSSSNTVNGALGKIRLVRNGL